MKNILEKLDKTKKYKLACGHNNAVVPNVWPFDTIICVECGFKTKRVEEVK